MHLAVDVREACRPNPTGKGVWTAGFVEELLTRDLDLTLWTDSPLPESWTSLLKDTSRGRRAVRTVARKGLLWHVEVAWALRRSRTDGYVSPTSYIVPSLVGRKVPCFPVVHDLIAFRDERHDQRAARIERLTLGRCVRKATHVCTVSAATRSDLLRRYPALDPTQISAVFAGPRRLDPPPGSRDRKVILCVSTLCPRKNQARLVAAFGRLPEAVRKDWSLVLAGGRGWDDSPIVEAVKRTPGVEWRSYVSEQELDDLLAHCSLVALPSLYEGFGLPILDAFQRGIPVLTSDRGSLKELAGGAAFIVDPESIESISRGLQTLMTDAALRDDFSHRGPARAARYSWTNTVDRFLAIARGKTPTPDTDE